MELPILTGKPSNPSKVSLHKTHCQHHTGNQEEETTAINLDNDFQTSD